MRIDDYLYKCPNCNNLKFEIKTLVSLSKNKEETNKEILYTCTKCGTEIYKKKEDTYLVR